MKLALICVDKLSGSPPLGLAYIASYLRKYHNFFNTIIIDKEEPIKKIEKEKPDVVGIASVTIDFPYAIKIARIIKSKFDIPILIGGHHISALPHTLQKVFDIGVIGEGEQTVLELVELYERYGEFSPRKLRNIDGIVFHNERGKNEITKPRKMIKPLDKIPYPARDLLDMKEYYLTPRMIPHIGREISIGTHVISSRGCPYKCAFCVSSRFWQMVRLSSAEYFVGELIELLEKYKKINSICIFDDLFAFSKGRLRKIVELIKKEKINEKVKFACWGKANLIDTEICKLLKEMNVKVVGLGLESGSDKILGYLKKNTATVNDNKKAIEMCKRFGFEVHGTFIFGSPNETMKDIEMTYNFIKDNPIDETNVYILTPYPGTEAWELAKKHNLVSEDMNWKNFNMGISVWESAKKGAGLSEDDIDIAKNDVYFVPPGVTKEEFLNKFYEICSFAYKKNYRDIKFNFKYLFYPIVIKKIFRRRKEAFNLLKEKIRRKIAI